jgi:hypothetical protein
MVIKKAICAGTFALQKPRYGSDKPLHCETFDRVLLYRQATTLNQLSCWQTQMFPTTLNGVFGVKQSV